jgi:hypothetical protein
MILEELISKVSSTSTSRDVERSLQVRGTTGGLAGRKEVTMSKELSNEKIERTKVSFESDGVELVSYLHHRSHATGRGHAL